MSVQERFKNTAFALRRKSSRRQGDMSCSK